MFGWFRKKVKPAPVDKNEVRFMAHFAAAEGTHIQRCSIAAAMSAIEDDFVQKERIRQTPEDQTLFMIAYECFVMWALKQGIEKVLRKDEVESACVAIHQHFVKHAWYQPVAFQKIWQEMQAFLSKAMTWDHGGRPPITFAEVLLATEQAGYPFNYVPDIRFILYVSNEVGRLAAVGQFVAKEHLELNRT